MTDNVISFKKKDAPEKSEQPILVKIVSRLKEILDHPDVVNNSAAYMPILTFHGSGMAIQRNAVKTAAARIHEWLDFAVNSQPIDENLNATLNTLYSMVDVSLNDPTASGVVNIPLPTDNGLYTIVLGIKNGAYAIANAYVDMDSIFPSIVDEMYAATYEIYGISDIVIPNGMTVLISPMQGQSYKRANIIHLASDIREFLNNLTCFRILVIDKDDQMVDIYQRTSATSREFYKLPVDGTYTK